MTIDGQNNMIIDALQTIGVEKDQVLLDFGCGTGDYSLPASHIVGRKGIVYALDMDSSCLNKINKKASEQNCTNIKVINTKGSLTLPLSDNSIDIVLLYDVIHSYYFTKEQRIDFYGEIKRVSKKSSIISIYPQHMDSEIIIREIENEGFYLSDSFYLNLLHYHVQVKDYIYNYRRH